MERGSLLCKMHYCLPNLTQLFQIVPTLISDKFLRPYYSLSETEMNRPRQITSQKVLEQKLIETNEQKTERQ